MSLFVPCTYQGAKQRIANQIVNYLINLSENIENTKFYDLCCGSGAVTIELLNHGIKPTQITMCDKSSYGKFWKEVGKGTFDIDKFFKYSKQVPRNKELVQSYMESLSKSNAEIDEEYVYLLLQACSFGGKQIWKEDTKWKDTTFRNYWKPTEYSNRRSPVNPMQPEIDVLEQRVQNIVSKCKGLVCYNTDIFEMIDIIKNDNNLKVVYIDPPYVNTTKYGFTFNHQEFINKLINVTDCPIVLSEYQMFSDICVELKTTGAKGGISGNKERQSKEYLNFYNVDINKINNVVKPKVTKKKLF